ncbi:hypothetical protein MG5_01403 [Candida albicans P57072]|nr:hypothetical protein MG5_01403 [Candida albicans P57072]
MSNNQSYSLKNQLYKAKGEVLKLQRILRTS